MFLATRIENQSCIAADLGNLNTRSLSLQQFVQPSVFEESMICRYLGWLSWSLLLQCMNTSFSGGQSLMPLCIPGNSSIDLCWQTPQYPRVFQIAAGSPHAEKPRNQALWLASTWSGEGFYGSAWSARRAGSDQTCRRRSLGCSGSSTLIRILVCLLAFSHLSLSN